MDLMACGGAVTVAGRYGIQAGLPTLRSDDLGSGVTRGYGRELVEAAVTGDAGPAALALAVHPLVPGVTVAREMISEYRERHGSHLACLR